MIVYLGYIIFILSVALAAGGIGLSSGLRKKYHHEIFSALLYFQVFIFTFGFYGIWGQEIIKVFLSTYISADLLTKFSDLALLLGLPFLVFAWLMLIQFSSGISGRKNTNWLVLWFLLFNFSVIIILGYLVAKGNAIKPSFLLKYYFISMLFLYSTISSLLILFPKKGKSIIHDFDRKRIGPGIFLVMLTQCVPLLFYNSQPFLAILFTFIFFCG